MVPPVGLAVIGIGRWGRAILRTVGSLPQAKLAAVVSRNPETAALLPADCLLTDAPSAALAHPAVQAVILAVPPQHHGVLARQALERGKAVMVEKPLTLDLREAERLAEIVRVGRGVVMVDHTHLFHPEWHALRERAARLGPPLSIESQARAWGPFRRDVPVLWDWGAHEVALCLDLVQGDPLQASATVHESRSVEGGRGEHVTLHLRFAGGLDARLEASNLSREKSRRFTVRFASETLEYRDPATNEPPLTRAIAAFLEAARGGVVSRSDVEFGVRVVRTLARCANSSGDAEASS